MVSLSRPMEWELQWCLTWDPASLVFRCWHRRPLPAMAVFRFHRHNTQVWVARVFIFQREEKYLPACKAHKPPSALHQSGSCWSSYSQWSLLRWTSLGEPFFSLEFEKRLFFYIFLAAYLKGLQTLKSKVQVVCSQEFRGCCQLAAPICLSAFAGFLLFNSLSRIFNMWSHGRFLGGSVV